MELLTIAEHTFDNSLIDENSTILDIGAGQLEFISYFEDKVMDIFAVDIQEMPDKLYTYQCAISNFNGKCGIQDNPDKQAIKIKEGNDIICHTLDEFSRLVNINFWDLIKFDCEGEEYNIIMSLQKAPARQISIEFHLHTGVYTTKEIGEMVYKLCSLGYHVVQHDFSERHGAGNNAWDSLFLLDK